MFKLILIGLVFVWLCEAAISSLQLVVPDDSYSVLTGGKSSTNTLGSTLSSLSNAISEEDKSSKAAKSEESNESVASSASSQSLALTASTATPDIAAGSVVPAALARVKPSSVSSAITSISTSGLSRASLLISSSAQASATANSLGSPAAAASSPIASVRSSATIQHRILPAETIPLPITISTRPGLRTIIAPETITIQQPAVAKVGEVVQQIPTAVSHQRQTVVHNHARVVTPIVAPAVRTVTSQIVRAYHTPLVYAPHVVEN